MAGSNPVPLIPPAGLKKGVSETSVAGAYVDGDHVRFWRGKAEKIKGWVKYIATQFIGVAHGSFAWISTGNNSLLAFGTFAKAYSVLDALDDITPQRTSGTLGVDPFAVVNLSTLVTVTHAAHGIGEAGAYVIFSGATAGGGITIDGEYLATYVNANSYTITHSAAATSTDATTGGGAVAYSYLIDNGLDSTALGLGFGVGTYGSSTYGTPRTSGGIAREMRTWFFDRYGSFLMLQPSGGVIYTWDEPASAARGVLVTNSPTSRASFITAERMMVALGTTTPMTMAWSDRDDPTNWTPGIGSTANIRTLQTGNRLIAGMRFPAGGGQVFWSDLAVYGMQFIGSSDFIYDTPVLGYDAGLIGPTAFEALGDMVVWLTPKLDVYIYAGSISKAPNFSDIQDYIRSRLNFDYADKITGGHTPNYEEFWFHYVSVDSASAEPDEYFKANTAEWVWDYGTLTRSAHVHSPAPGGAVVMFGTDSYIYQHEIGTDADGAALPWSLRAGRIAIGNGSVDMDLNGYIPDFERQTGAVTLTMTMFERPQSTTPIDEQTFMLNTTDEIVDMVMGGRYLEYEYSANQIGSDFRLGTPLLDAASAGESR